MVTCGVPRALRGWGMECVKGGGQFQRGWQGQGKGLDGEVELKWRLASR